MSPAEIEKKPWIIYTQEELKLLAKWLGVRDDWHEPGEQGVGAELHGGHLDNAGFWGSHVLERERNDPHPMGGRQTTEQDLEFWVTITKDGKPVAEIDVATLLAFACGTYDGSNANPRGRMKSHWAWVIKNAIQNAAKSAIR